MLSDVLGRDRLRIFRVVEERRGLELLLLRLWLRRPLAGGRVEPDCQSIVNSLVVSLSFEAWCIYLLGDLVDRRRPRVSLFVSFLRSKSDGLGLPGLPFITDRDGGRKLPVLGVSGAAPTTSLPPLAFPMPLQTLLFLHFCFSLGPGEVVAGPGFPSRQLKDLRIAADKGCRAGVDMPQLSASLSSLTVDPGRDIRSIDKRLADLRSFLASFSAPLLRALSSEVLLASVSFSLSTPWTVSWYLPPVIDTFDKLKAVNGRFIPF